MHLSHNAGAIKRLQEQQRKREDALLESASVVTALRNWLCLVLVMSLIHVGLQMERKKSECASEPQCRSPEEMPEQQRKMEDKLSQLASSQRCATSCASPV